MYVWFDALTNYISGVDLFDEDKKLAGFWPANLHLIGKDIMWFHCVIWPCMLMSAGLPVPQSVFGHGFVSAADGRKMSKSLGNVVCPNEILNTYSSDTIRYYTMTSAKFGSDLKFDVSAMIDQYNADLADTLGNLLHRASGLCAKICEGVVPDVPIPDGDAPFDFEEVRSGVERHMASFCIQEALEAAMNACRDTNKYLTDRSPWSTPDVVEKKEDSSGGFRSILHTGALIGANRADCSTEHIPQVEHSSFKDQITLSVVRQSKTRHPNNCRKCVV